MCRVCLESPGPLHRGGGFQLTLSRVGWHCPPQTRVGRGLLVEECGRVALRVALCCAGGPAVQSCWNVKLFGTNSTHLHCTYGLDVPTFLPSFRSSFISSSTINRPPAACQALCRTLGCKGEGGDTGLPSWSSESDGR